MATSTSAQLERLIAIMDTLLSEGGCPWDRAQTLETLRSYCIEEAFEVVEAIDKGDPKALKEELGDLLFQIIFQSALTQRSHWFSLQDVIEGVASKMERRHPWVFGSEKSTEDPEASFARWEAQKAKEKRERGEQKGALSGVPAALPALLRALRVGEKAAAHGYDWPDARGVRAKVDEELAELDAAMAARDREDSSDTRAAEEGELGDALFALANLARKRGIDPEAALRQTLARFSDRFTHAERAAHAQARALAELSDEERDQLWEEAKAR